MIYVATTIDEDVHAFSSLQLVLDNFRALRISHVTALKIDTPWAINTSWNRKEDIIKFIQETK